MREHQARLVFVDETSTNTKMVRLRGRSCKGQRLNTAAPFGRWGTQTFVAGLRCNGLVAPWIINAPMNSAIFATLCRDATRANTSTGRCGHHGQSMEPQKREGREVHPRQRRMAPVPATLQPRPEPNRIGLRQTQGKSARYSRKDNRPALESHRGTSVASTLC